MTQYDTLLKAVQDAHIFQRNKIALETKVLACLLYLAGLSYSVMTLQTGIIIPACYRSVHYYWVHAEAQGHHLKGPKEAKEVRRHR